MKNSLTVWLLQTGEPLHIDLGNPRPMRAMNLSNSLVDAGHNVVLWSSAFYHQEKKYRSLIPHTIKVSPQLEIRLIPSPGYKRNIGFGRLWDHFVLAYNLKKMLRREQSLPDVAFVGYPPIETASVLVRWLTTRGIPCMLDLKDQWPTLFLDPLPAWSRPLAKFFLSPYFYYGKRAMLQATGLSSMAGSFLQWGLDMVGRKKTKYDGIFPLTSPSISIEDGQLNSARLWWDEKKVTDDPSLFRVIFIGSHMSVFDFEPIRDAALNLIERGIRCQFVICGDGGFSTQLRLMMENIPNVYFPGWVDRAQIEALAERSQAALAPYRNIDNFIKNLPNKVIDALALGLPILSPLHGEVANIISEYKVGLQYSDDPSRSLFACIEDLRNSTDKQKQMSINARKLFREKFSFEMVYSGLVMHLEAMARSNHSK